MLNSKLFNITYLFPYAINLKKFLVEKNIKLELHLDSLHLDGSVSLITLVAL